MNYEKALERIRRKWNQTCSERNFQISHTIWPHDPRWASPWFRLVETSISLDSKYKATNTTNSCSNKKQKVHQIKSAGVRIRQSREEHKKLLDSRQKGQQRYQQVQTYNLGKYKKVRHAKCRYIRLNRNDPTKWDFNRHICKLILQHGWMASWKLSANVTVHQGYVSPKLPTSKETLETRMRSAPVNSL